MIGVQAEPYVETLTNGVVTAEQVQARIDTFDRIANQSIIGQN